MINQFSLLAWNIRGAGNDEAKRHVADLCREHRPDVFFVLERHVPFESVRSSWDFLGYDSTEIMDPDGFSGGIWVLWKSHRLHVHILSSMHQCITFMVNGNSSNPWMCSTVYASPSTVIREQLWNHLRDLSTQYNQPRLSFFSNSSLNSKTYSTGCPAFVGEGGIFSL